MGFCNLLFYYFTLIFIAYRICFRTYKKCFTKIKDFFPYSSSSNTSLTAEVNSGFAKRVRQDNASEKHLQENRPTVGMYQLLIRYLIT